MLPWKVLGKDLSLAHLLTSGGFLAIFHLPWFVDTHGSNLYLHMLTGCPLCVYGSKIPPFLRTPGILL